MQGKPEEVFPELFRTWNIKLLTWEYDIEPYAKKRDSLVENMAKEYKVKVEEHVSHTLYNTNLWVALTFRLQSHQNTEQTPRLLGYSWTSQNKAQID